MIQDVTSSDQLNWDGQPLVVCFTNPVTCAPCKMLEPHYKNVAGELGDRVAFYEVNILDHMDIAGEFGVMGTPTLFFIGQNGKVTLNARTTQPLINEISSLL